MGACCGGFDALAHVQQFFPDTGLLGCGAFGGEDLQERKDDDDNSVGVGERGSIAEIEALKGLSVDNQTHK